MKNTLFSTARCLAVSLALPGAGLVAGCKDKDDNKPPYVAPLATASLVNTAGQPVGEVNLSEAENGIVTVTVNITGLSPGNHGIHFHAVGKAEPATAFMSAGAHFNPTMKQHGLSNPLGTHGGDLPNLVADAQGVGTLATTTDRITLSDGPKSVFDSDGTVLVVHANADDQVSDPIGNSGGRLAAGVVVKK